MDTLSEVCSKCDDTGGPLWAYKKWSTGAGKVHDGGGIPQQEYLLTPNPRKHIPKDDD
jgi:hypothetical protein